MFRNLFYASLCLAASGCGLVATKNSAPTFPLKDCEKGVCIVRYIVDNSIHFKVQNPYDFDLTVSLRVEPDVATVKPGKTGQIPTQIDRVLTSHQEADFLILKPVKNISEMRYPFHLWWKLGSKDAVPDQSLYGIPLQVGSEVEVGQGNDGNLSHFDESKYALDFDVPEGTQVCAARGGRVVEVKEDSSRGGKDPSFGPLGNFVIILQGDGTLAEYLHLEFHGALVKLGEYVVKGQPIALSGSTGYTTKPHLHFQVYRPVDGRRTQSLLIKYHAKEKSNFVPAYGEKITVD